MVCPPRRAKLHATASFVVTGDLSCPPWRANHLGGELPQFWFFYFVLWVLFTSFCFGLTLGMVIKVLKGFIILQMILN